MNNKNEEDELDAIKRLHSLYGPIMTELLNDMFSEKESNIQLTKGEIRKWLASLAD